MGERGVRENKIRGERIGVLGFFWVCRFVILVWDGGGVMGLFLWEKVLMLILVWLVICFFVFCCRILWVLTDFFFSFVGYG